MRIRSDQLGDKSMNEQRASIFIYKNRKKKAKSMGILYKGKMQTTQSICYAMLWDYAL